MQLNNIRKIANTINSVILIMVFGLMGFFKMCDVDFLVYFSIPTAMVYIIGYILINKGMLTAYVRMVYFWLTFYMCVTTVCLGYTYGFHLYCFSMIPIAFVTEYMAYKLGTKGTKAMYMSIAISIMYIFCTGYVGIYGPVFYRDQKYAAFFWMFNAAIVFFFLIFYSSYLINMIITSEEKLKEIAHKDRLTKLYNRHYMIDHLESLPDGPDAGYLAMADIDNFKKINDVYGHNAGDLILKTVAEKLNGFCSGSVTSRWGGEEFLIYLPADGHDVLAVLDKVREEISKNVVHFEDKDISVTVTIGLYRRRDGQTIDEWVQQVDKNLYIGKNNGKNKVVYVK